MTSKKNQPRFVTSCLGRKLWSRRLSLFASRLVTSTDFQEPEPEAPRYRATVPWNAFNAICGAVFYRTTLCQSEVLRCHPDKGRSHALFCLAGNKWKRDVLICADLHFRTVALATFLCRFAVLLLANLHLGTCDPSGGRGHCFSPAADALISKHHGVTWWHIACIIMHRMVTWYNGMVRNVWICRQAEGSFDLGCKAFGHEKLGGNPVSKIFQSKKGTLEKQ